MSMFDFNPHSLVSLSQGQYGYTIGAAIERESTLAHYGTSLHGPPGSQQEFIPPLVTDVHDHAGTQQQPQHTVSASTVHVPHGPVKDVNGAGSGGGAGGGGGLQQEYRQQPLNGPMAETTGYHELPVDLSRPTKLGSNVSAVNGLSGHHHHQHLHQHHPHHQQQQHHQHHPQQHHHHNNNNNNHHPQQQHQQHLQHNGHAPLQQQLGGGGPGGGGGGGQGGGHHPHHPGKGHRDYDNNDPTIGSYNNHSNAGNGHGGGSMSARMMGMYSHLVYSQEIYIYIYIYIFLYIYILEGGG